MNDILKWLRDPFLHIFLGAAFGGLVYLFFSSFDTPEATVRSGALFLYLREVTQVQDYFYDSNFLKGWTLRADIHRWAEWVLPWAVLELLVYLFC